jgi:hypothetical protein
MARDLPEARTLSMKTKTISQLICSIILSFVTPTAFAAGHGGGGGGFLGGGGGHVSSGGGRVSGSGGFRSAGPGLRGGPYYYSRGMHFAHMGIGQYRSPVRQSPSVARPNRGVNNPTARAAKRVEFNRQIAAHVGERHDSNWHRDWDRRHAHFDHHRFFVFIDGFWCGLDDGLFPWDYYPYYAYDYYPYDYHPGLYADSEPYYYDNGVYSSTPMRDPTVATVQTELTQQGYYGGPVDGIYGPATRDAVAKYQIAKNLEVTGSLSPDTLTALGLPEMTPG